VGYIVAVFVVGCIVIAWNRSAARAGASASVWRRVQAMGWGVALLPIAITAFALFGTTPWTVAMLALAGMIVILAPGLAGSRVPPALLLLGLFGILIAALLLVRNGQASTGHLAARASPSPTSAPGVAPRIPPVPHLVHTVGAGGVASGWRYMLVVTELCLFLAAVLWFVPRAFGADSWMARNLARRVQRLAETRTEAVDSAAAELRRVERDLHDGAQARLVALGMNLRAAERLMPTSPQAALALVAEARETSSRALMDLRDLVRGIHPPVLADRGLADAVRALALDTPLRTSLDIDFPGRLDAPVESALYFAVAEVLANAVKHAGARAVEIKMQHREGVLRIAVTDDGVGGADPAKGTGLRGIERRLGAFDGILVVNSPPGGPTMVIIEVPCGLS
jgi:signal transduction histidine kinase